MLLLEIRDGIKRRTETGGQMIKQSRPEGKAEEVEIEMTDFAPGSPVAGSPFWNKGMDVRIPLEITAKGVKDSDETGGEGFRAVHF